MLIPPPPSETIIPVRINGANTDSEWGIMESIRPTEVHINVMLIAKALVDLKKGTAVLRLLNVTQEQKTTCKEVNREPVACVTTGRPLKSTKEVGVARMTSPEALSPSSGAVVLSLYRETLTQRRRQHACCVNFLICSLWVLMNFEVQTSLSLRSELGMQSLFNSHSKDYHCPNGSRPRKPLKRPSASAWSSPVVLVTKKDGSTRFCMDYWRLNDVTQKDSYSLPRIDDTLDALDRARWCSTLDLKVK